MSMRMAPDAPWQTSEGSSKITMTMGGRYMIEQTNFQMMGMETKGMLIQGFDTLFEMYDTIPETPEAPMPEKPNMMVMKMEYTCKAE